MGKEFWEKYKKSFLVFGLCLLIGITAQIGGNRSGELSEENTLEREKTGGGEKQQELELVVPDWEESTEITIRIPEQILPEKERQELFERAEKEIDDTFPGDNASVDHIEKKVQVEKTYQEGVLKAEWSFDDYEIMNPDGTVNDELLKAEGQLLTATVELTYENYADVYSFPFRVYPRSKTERELFFEILEKNMRAQEEKQGEEDYTLPTEVNGLSVEWQEKPDQVVLPFLLLGIIAAVLVVAAEKSRERKASKVREQQLLFDYPEMVSKLSLLLEAGMNITLAWGKIAQTYENQRKQKVIEEKPTYEEMLVTYREIQDGGGERLAYERFGERCGIQVYRKLASLISQNLRKGSNGLTMQMEREAEDAFEIRKNLAKKYGEEAGTKLLGPMMLMMFIIMIIIMVPALISFRM